MDVKSGAVYRHYKGNMYRVVAVARHSETLERMVVYQALYGEMDYWVRPEKMFAETVVTPDGEKPRFEMINDDK